MKLPAFTHYRQNDLPAPAPLATFLQPIFSAGGALVAQEVLVRPVDYAGGAEAYYSALARAPLARRIDMEMASLRLAAQVAMIPGAKAINVSLPLLLSDVGQAALSALLRARPEGHGQLTLELLEYDSAPVDDLADVIDWMVSLGAHISLDDFGRGQASLAMLSGLSHIHQIKFDASLVHSRRRDVVLPALAQMVRDMGAVSVAEQVDSELTLEVMRRCGVDCLQGFHLGMPEPVEV